MTASALNSASIAPNAAAGPAGATAPAAAGATSGFDALLAALFPQGAPVDAPAPETTAPGASQAAPLLAAATDVEDASIEGEADATAEDATDADPEAAAILTAALAAPQAATTQPATTAQADSATHTPHAWGRDKAKGVPAQPAILHANPNAGLAAKAELADEVPEDETPTPAAPEAPIAGQKGNAAAAPAPSPRAVAQAAAGSAVNPAAAPPPAPDAAPDVAVAAAPPPTATEAPPPEGAPPASQAQTLAAGQGVAKPESTPVAPARPARAERGRSAEAAALKPLEAADRPVHAKAVDAAAKGVAASVDESAPEVAEVEAEAAADAPDASVPADARAAAQSAAPAAHTTHAVRGSPETVANLAAAIVKKLEGQSTRFDLELNPQGLGKVDVRIEIGAQGQLSASMLFDNAQAAQELKSRATELQRALEQAGFDLSGGLSFDVADQGRQGQAWQDPGDTGRAFRGQAFRAALETAGDAADAAAHGALRLRRGVNAGLDLRI